VKYRVLDTKVPHFIIEDQTFFSITAFSEINCLLLLFQTSPAPKLTPNGSESLLDFEMENNTNTLQ
jgi:hypothetical protein